METPINPPDPTQNVADLPPGNSWRDRVGDGWLRVFIFDHWFGIATLLFLAFVAFLGLFLTKIWTATPEWVTPTLKISGLDMAQGWSLERSANAMFKEGNLTEAVLTWRSAGFHSPGNPQICRDLLTAVSGPGKVDRRYTAIGYDRSVWLLKLTRTNLDDLTLVGTFLRKYEIDDWLLQLTSNLTNQIPRKLAASVLVASFNRGQMRRFGVVWDQHRDYFSQDPLLSLYRLAWEAGWGPLSGMQGARRRIQELQTTATGDAAETLRRVQLYLAYQLTDVRQYKTALDWLIDHHVDRVAEHVNYWRLLVRSGRRGDAKELARGFSRPPDTVADAVGLGSTFSELGLPSVAVEFAAAQLKDFPFSNDLWTLLADQRIELKDWAAVRQTAVAMRNEPALQGRMAGIASFLEGLVALRTGDSEGAAKQFTISAGGRFPKVSDAFAVSERMLKYGFPEQSALLLKTIEGQYSNDVQFWAQLTTAAYESRQMDIMTRAAKKTMDLAPNELIYVNNYAAVLLALRQNPEEAVKLTFRLILKSPENRDYQINHSLALIQNARLEEAETLLKRFNPATMNPVEAASVNLGWFEIHIRRGNVSQAREVVRAIDTSRLMEPQVRWIGEQLKKLETR